ncbi:MAG: hypothetical protein KJN71_02930 [Acidimicrobiia bacterium]|nr:hypothetical protein [Acidimicrobiia bacterium]NNC75008.1 hypothetical protein [Acidimicrobiia bacterium]
MADRTKKVLKYQSDVLEPDEEVLATLLTLPHGGVKSIGVAGGVGGVLGSAGSSAGMRSGAQKAMDKAQMEGDSLAAQFPIGLLLVSVTNKRVLCFSRPSIQSDKPERLIAAFPKELLVRSWSKRAFMKHNLTLEFSDGSTLLLDSGIFQPHAKFHTAVAG